VTALKELSSSGISSISFEVGAWLEHELIKIKNINNFLIHKS
jgi:hypothetical protein